MKAARDTLQANRIARQGTGCRQHAGNKGRTAACRQQHEANWLRPTQKQAMNSYSQEDAACPAGCTLDACR